MTDHVPNQNQNQKKRDIGDHSACGKGNGNNTPLLHHKNDAWKNCSSEYGFCDLFTHDTCEEKGIQTSNDGIDSGEDQSNEKAQSAG